MKYKDISRQNVVLLLIILCVVYFFYVRYADKLNRSSNVDDYKEIQKYLLDSKSLERTSKPILWLYVNDCLKRGNNSFINLTMSSILKHCSNDFTICFIDNNSFASLLPSWNINMNLISSPILDNVVLLGLLKLLEMYGGLLCPSSFICHRSLLNMYSECEQRNKMVICETINRNITSNNLEYSPNVGMCCTLKENDTITQLIQYVEMNISTDNTHETKFMGKYNQWCRHQVSQGNMLTLAPEYIGMKSMSGQQVLIDELMSNTPIDFLNTKYGVLVCYDELMLRNKSSWIIHLDKKEILELNVNIGKLLLHANSDIKY